MLVWCTERVINDNFVGIGAVDCELESNVINVKWSYIERKFCEDVYEQNMAILRFFTKRCKTKLSRTTDSDTNQDPGLRNIYTIRHTSS